MYSQIFTLFHTFYALFTLITQYTVRIQHFCWTFIENTNTCVLSRRSNPISYPNFSDYILLQIFFCLHNNHMETTFNLWNFLSDHQVKTKSYPSIARLELDTLSLWDLHANHYSNHSIQNGMLKVNKWVTIIMLMKSSSRSEQHVQIIMTNVMLTTQNALSFAIHRMVHLQYSTLWTKYLVQHQNNINARNMIFTNTWNTNELCILINVLWNTRAYCGHGVVHRLNTKYVHIKFVHLNT